MLTAVVSDLHLGGRGRRDLLRTAAAREAFLAGLGRADRLVLLGDVLELREGPAGEALAAARPFFDELDEAFAGKEVLLSAGNHDHQLVGGLLDEHSLDGGRALGLEERARPDRGIAGRIAALMPRVEAELAYPGIWLRDDVYATHGHYMDCHNTVPTLERLGAALSERIGGGTRGHARSPGDYESALAPIYSLLYALAQAPRPARALGSGASVQLWEKLNRDGARRGLGARILGGALVPGAVAALNRTGLGAFNADLSATELRRAGLRAMGDAVRCLRIEAEHVIFGHTHRSGPLPWDDEQDWLVPGTSVRLVNSGSWIHEPAFIGSGDPKRSPYWPGVCVWVDEEGPPRLERLLDELPLSA